MANLADIEWEECLVPPRKDAEVEREFRRSFGAVPPSIPYLANSPWLVRAQARCNYRSGQLVHIDCDLADLIFLAVSQDNSCRFCYAAQRSALRILGFDAERILRVEEAASSAETDQRENRALDFARRLSRSNPAPGKADAELLREVGYGDQGIQEIAYIAAYTVSANRAVTLPAIPTAGVDALADRPLVRLLRPLIARLILSK